MTLEEQWEQWQEDKTQFLTPWDMWEWKLCYRTEWQPAKNERDVEWTLNSVNYDVRRKQSAALPFDLVAAMAGDVFEYFFAGAWCPLIWGDDDFCEIELDGEYSWVFDSSDNLRMKYPRYADAERYKPFEDKT